MKKVYIGQNISYLRKKKNFSQTEIAKRFNVGASTWSGYEKGRIKLPFETLLQLAEYFNVNLDDFIYTDLTENKAEEPPSKSSPASQNHAPKKTDIASAYMTIHLTKNIKHLREHKNWSRADLADQLKIDASEIATWEDANELPPVEMAINLCIVFKIAIEDILFKNLDEEAYRLLEGPAKSYEVLQDEMIELLQFKVNAYELRIKEEAPELAKKLGLE